MQHFYDLAEIPPDEVRELLTLAGRLRNHPEPRALEGKVLSLLFLNPSLRTISSFQAAMTRLGGGTFVISPEKSTHGLETHDGIVMEGRAAEHTRDAIPVLDAYADVMGIRAFAERRDMATDLSDKSYKSMASLVRCPLINMESAAFHPCQSLADWKTLDELESVQARRRGKLVITWAFHPRALPLSGPTSTLQMAAMRGMNVVVLRPDGFGLPPSIMNRATDLAEKYGGTVSETSDRREALEGATVVYVKEWSSTACYGDRLADEKARNELTDWCIDETWFNHAAEDCRVMHAMPVRRGVAVSDRVLDGPRSSLTQQAGNRMWTQMALLHRLLIH